MATNISPGDEEFSFEEFEEGFVFDTFGEKYKKDGEETKPEGEETKSFKPVNRISKYFRD